MSNTTVSNEAYMSGLLRNALLGLGFLFLPLATLFEVFFPSPSNMHTGMILLFAAMGLFFFGFGGFMEAQRRKALKAPDTHETPKSEHEATSQANPQSEDGLRLPELLIGLAIFMTFGIGFVAFAGAYSQGSLADRFASEAEAYDMSSAAPADDMLKTLGFSAKQSALVAPLAGAGAFPVICARNADGALDLYKMRIEGDISKVAKLHMGDTLRTAAEPFCDAAFAHAIDGSAAAK